MNCSSCKNNYMKVDGDHVCTIIAQRLWEKNDISEWGAVITKCVVAKSQPAVCPLRWFRLKKFFNFFLTYDWRGKGDDPPEGYEPRPEDYWLNFILLHNAYEARIPIQRGVYKYLPASSIFGRLIEWIWYSLKEIVKKTPHELTYEHIPIWAGGRKFFLMAERNIIDAIEIRTRGGWVPWNPKVPTEKDVTLSMQITLDTKDCIPTPEVFFYPSIHIHSIMDLRYLNARKPSTAAIVSGGIPDDYFDTSPGR